MSDESILTKLIQSKNVMKIQADLLSKNNPGCKDLSALLVRIGKLEELIENIKLQGKARIILGKLITLLQQNKLNFKIDRSDFENKLLIINFTLDHSYYSISYQFDPETRNGYIVLRKVKNFNQPIMECDPGNIIIMKEFDHDTDIEKYAKEYFVMV